MGQRQFGARDPGNAADARDSVEVGFAEWARRRPVPIPERMQNVYRMMYQKYEPFVFDALEKSGRWAGQKLAPHEAFEVALRTHEDEMALDKVLLADPNVGPALKENPSQLPFYRVKLVLDRYLKERSSKPRKGR